MRLSTSSAVPRSQFFRPVTIISALGALLGSASAGCGARADDLFNVGGSAQAPKTVPATPTGTRERRAGRLLEMAREAGILPSEEAQLVSAARASLGVGAAVDAGAPVDAGAGNEVGVDAGVTVPSEPVPSQDPGDVAPPAPADAGIPAVPDPVPTGDGGPAAPPEVVPVDVVAQSALPIYGLEAGVVLTEAQLWDRLAESQVVCLGEFHDVAGHHYAQARALDELAARAADRGLTQAVGFEMFQKPFQAPLSAYVAGELGEEELLAQTQWVARWGYDFALYRPLVEGARSNGLEALALNAPTELTRKIGRTGLASLDATELAQVPELVLDDVEHRAFIFSLFGLTPEQAAELGLENIYVAQTTWDETMAESSARWLAATGPNARLLNFAGGAHCHEAAIPRRLTRRTGQPTLSVHAVFESELQNGSFTPEGYDVLVVLDD